jgi:glutaredoxin-like protein NrdH
MSVVHVAGKKSHDVMFYGLSTCGWCRKTKQLLDSLGIEYDFEYVDQAQGNDRAKAMHEVTRCNPQAGFPTIIIDKKKCIVGYKEDEIRGALGK